MHEDVPYRLLPCQGSPCPWKLTRGVVITYVEDLLFTGFQYHVNAVTKALLAKYVMKQSGILPVETPGMEKLEGIDFLGARITRDGDKI